MLASCEVVVHHRLVRVLVHERREGIIRAVQEEQRGAAPAGFLARLSMEPPARAPPDQKLNLPYTSRIYFLSC